MTREEAFKNLVALHAVCGQKDFFDKEFEEALLVAEKALEQQPCEDAISREDLKDAIGNLNYWHANQYGKLRPGGAGDYATVYKANDVERMADTLPSVKPKDDNRLKFLEFLYNTINPNEMETYMEMFKATNDKTDKGC